MESHKNLIVWQKSIDLVKLVYSTMHAFPHEELFGLVSQIKRAVVSIPSNIAEGFGRGSKKECKRFIHIALGSAIELDTQIIISKELGFLGEEEYRIINSLLLEIKKMLKSLIRSLNTESLVN
ncbi:MAG: four helix bundle protein [Prevotella sp.]|jgi:four helix bundle protein|nr:four helix bundle protein [Prevotella sp.]